MRVGLTLKHLDAGDPADLAESTLELRQELAELDLDVENLPRTDTPDGAKTGMPVSAGELVIALAGAGGALSALIGLLQDWLTRRGQHRIVLEVNGDRLEINGAVRESESRLVEAWLNRRSQHRNAQ